MGRSKIYWILVFLGGLAAVAGLLMMRSADISLRRPGQILGWSGIAILLIGRIFFSRKRQPQPLKPKTGPEQRN